MKVAVAVLLLNKRRAGIYVNEISLSTGVILASERRCKGTSTPSIRSPVVSEGRMGPGHWLGLIFLQWFNIIRLADRKDVQPVNEPVHLSPSRVNWLTEDHEENDR